VGDQLVLVSIDKDRPHAKIIKQVLKLVSG
jgi:hypothetical protein